MQKNELTEKDTGRPFSGPSALLAQRWRVTKDERGRVLRGARGQSCNREDLRETLQKAANTADWVERETRQGWYWGGRKYYLPEGWTITWSVNPICRDRQSSTDFEVHIVWYTHPKYDTGGLPLKMGLCTFGNYLGYKERYWWDVRPPPVWWDPDQGVRDPTQGANFDPEA